MSRFNDGQLETLVDRFWKLEDLMCPHDGTKIWARLYSQLTGYLLVLGCPRCGIKGQITQYSDPLRRTFRKWTESEGCALAQDYECERCVCCPVCRSRVKCRTQGEPIQVLECPRCGNQHMTMALLDEATSWSAESAGVGVGWQVKEAGGR